MSATNNDQAAKTDTAYVVLQRIPAPEGSNAQGYTVLGRFSASGDLKAIDHAADAAGLEEGTFIAVPTRSFRERTLKTEKVTKRRVQ